MQTTNQPAIARARQMSVAPLVKLWLASSIIFMALVWAVAANAQNINKVFGLSNFGSLKYGPDMKNLDYVNPNAPKGGEIAIWASGTFDSMNPYSSKGRSGALSSIQF